MRTIYGLCCSILIIATAATSHSANISKQIDVQFGFQEKSVTLHDTCIAWLQFVGRTRAAPHTPNDPDKRDDFCCEIDHLSHNRTSDQLSPRTPPAIFHLDFAPNASPNCAHNFSRHHSVPAARTAPREQSIFYSFVFSIF
jgi:hypothetical protein